MPKETIIEARLIMRNDSSEKWNEKNSILLKGEPGYSVEDRILKIGDGKTPWNELPSVSGGSILPATEDTIGGVLSSLEDNKVAVKEDGTMELNRVSTSLLFVPETDDLILDGGQA